MSHNTRPVDLGKLEAPSYRSGDERFWSKVRKTAGCWLWTGSVFGSNAYGQFTMPGAKNGRVYAHRHAWELANGRTVPPGLFVLHTCDTPRCVKPAHLYVGTHKKNMEDAQARGRLHTPRPRKQKIPDADLPTVFDMRRRGLLLREIAGHFGVHKVTISTILNGHRRQYATVGHKRTRHVA